MPARFTKRAYGQAWLRSMVASARGKRARVYGGRRAAQAESLLLAHGADLPGMDLAAQAIPRAAGDGIGHREGSHATFEKRAISPSANVG